MDKVQRATEVPESEDRACRPTCCCPKPACTVGEQHAKLGRSTSVHFFCDSDLISGAKWFSLASGPHESDPLTLKFTASVRVRSDRVGGRERCGGSGNLRGFARSPPPSPTIRTASIRDRRHDHLGNSTPDPRAMR
jgi:hypothetical protein